MRRISGICGIAFPLVGLSVILAVISRATWFSWTEYDISVLGVEGSATVFFNLGLIFTGLLGVVFLTGLSKNLVSNRIGKLGLLSLLLGSVGISGTGLFPRSGGVPHDIASVGGYVFMVLALVLIGFAAMRNRRMMVGVSCVLGGVITIVILTVPWPWSGGAIEQVLACIPWASWTIMFGVRLLVNARPIEI